MAGRDIVGGLSKAAAAAAKAPVDAAGQAIGVAKGVVAKGAGVADKLLHGGTEDQTQASVSEAAAQEATERQPTGEDEPRDEAQDRAPDEAGVEPETTEPPEPQVVLAEPAAPTEPPIDVVGRALAAEDQGPREGHATEPKASTRDESHGDAALQRAEADEIAEEIAESFPAGGVDIATPVGTTGADVGFNPDTAEADLQQPGTEPLVDPSLTKAVKSEQDMLRRAAEGRAVEE